MVVRLSLSAVTDAAVAAALVARESRAAGLANVAAFRVATSAAELATNAVRHAGGGDLVFSASHTCVVLAVVDRGAGSASSLRAALGAATSARPFCPRASLGAGLAAVVRLMDRVAFADREGGGVIVIATLSRLAGATGEQVPFL
jgi:anti-sigma regulatory factor (Ser/Thr protein kinase)